MSIEISILIVLGRRADGCGVWRGRGLVVLSQHGVTVLLALGSVICWSCGGVDSTRPRST